MIAYECVGRQNHIFYNEISPLIQHSNAYVPHVDITNLYLSINVYEQKSIYAYIYICVYALYIFIVIFESILICFFLLYLFMFFFQMFFYCIWRNYNKHECVILKIDWTIFK